MAITLNGTTGITDVDGGTLLSTADIASQAEAEAGTDNTKWMTPERVAQSIAALASSGFTFAAPVATTTSISSVTFTGIPADAKEIIMGIFYTFPQGGKIRLGSSSGIISSGYNANQTVFNARSSTTAQYSDGVPAAFGTNDFVTGLFRIQNFGALLQGFPDRNVWVIDGVTNKHTAGMYLAVGSLSTPAVIDRIQLVSTQGVFGITGGGSVVVGWK